MWLSKSSPPRKVSPLVALTSNTPPMISRIDTSNVPPPKSYTAIVPSCEQMRQGGAGLRRWGTAMVERPRNQVVCNGFIHRHRSLTPHSGQRGRCVEAPQESSANLIANELSTKPIAKEWSSSAAHRQN
eukprot:351544-Chlamydomonas_euryale.AAC.4